MVTDVGKPSGPPCVTLRADRAGPVTSYWFHCQGCGHPHRFRVAPGLPGPSWMFDGDMAAPTFSPSLLNTTDDPPSRCHLYLRAGMVEFLPDCTHALAGVTVPLKARVPIREAE